MTRIIGESVTNIVGADYAPLPVVARVEDELACTGKYHSTCTQHQIGVGVTRGHFDGPVVCHIGRAGKCQHSSVTDDELVVGSSAVRIEGKSRDARVHIKGDG